MRSVTVSLFVMGLVLVGLTGMAHAETVIIPIENATFDTDFSGWEPASGTSAVLWSGSDSGADAEHPSTSDGGFANVKGGTSGRMMRQWPLNETVMVAQGTYTLTFDASNQENDEAKDSEVLGMLQFYDGSATGSLADETFTLSGTTYAVWDTYTVTYVALPGDPHIGQQLGVYFSGGDGLSRYSGVDNISLTYSETIPEPNSMIIFTIGLFGLLAYAWRKRKLS